MNATRTNAAGPASGPSLAGCRRRGLADAPRVAALGLSLVLLALLSASAQAAERATVAVLEFDKAPKLQAAVVDFLGQRYKLVPLPTWRATAAGLNATGHASDEIAIVAMTLKVDAVVTGVAKPEPGGQWLLTVSARHGPSGKPVERLRYPLRSATTLRALLQQIGPAVERAIREDAPASPGAGAQANATNGAANVTNGPMPPAAGRARPQPARVQITPPLRLRDGSSDRDTGSAAPSVRDAPAAPLLASRREVRIPAGIDRAPIPPLAVPGLAPSPLTAPTAPTGPAVASAPPAPASAGAALSPAAAAAAVDPGVTPPDAVPPDGLPPLPPDPDEVRPVWYPYFDVSAGLVIGGRSFAYDERLGASPVRCYDFLKPIADPRDPTAVVHRYTSQLTKCPGFSGAVTGGLRVDGTFYPLAASSNRWVRQLGIGATVDWMVWPDSRLGGSTNPDPITGDPTPPTRLPTRELRAEVGLRWTWNLLNKRSRPSLMVSAQYGLHYFALDHSNKNYEYQDLTTGELLTVAGQDDHGLPDIFYQYLDFGVGARVPFYGNRRWYIGLLMDLHYHAMLSYGDIASTFAGGSAGATQVAAGLRFDNLYQGGGFGPVGSGHGVRIGMTPLELVPWRGVTIRLSGYYEAFLMSFQLGNLPDPDALPPQNRTPDKGSRHVARGATDQYFGGVLQLGYQY